MITYEPLDYSDLIRVDTPQGRKYTTPEGRSYISVTTLLNSLADPGIERWEANVGPERAEAIRKYSTDRGTFVHHQIEQRIRQPNYIFEQTNHTHMADAVWNYLANNCTKCIASEIPLYSDKLQLAGTCDFIGEINEKVRVVDFKTAKYPKDLDHLHKYHLQLSFYSWMLYDRYRINAPDLIVVIATEIRDLQIVPLKRISLSHLFALFPQLVQQSPEVVQ